jgi:hypothetical protein
LSSPWLIRPEEIISELRKRYPTEKIFAPRPVAPRITYANEYLYGVVIYVYGEGIRGQYLRHQYIDREGKRYWGIEYGWVSLYGIKEDGMILPLTILGMPTRFVFEYKPEEFKDYRIEEIPLGFLECQEAQMVNIDRVMRGEDAVLIIDKYDLLRTNGGPTPSEFMERIIEQQTIIENLQKAVWEYERGINDYKISLSISQSRLAKTQELLTSYETKLTRHAIEVTSIQQELIRLREEVLIRVTEAESLEKSRDRLRDIFKSIIDDLTEVVTDISDLIKRIEEETKEAKEAVKEREKK